jgi:zinc protease
MRSLFILLLGAAAAFAQAPAKAPAAKSAPAKSASVPAGAWKTLKYPKLGEIKIPDVETVTLKNGVKVYLLENHALPFITGSALIRTGTLLDPPAKTGLAEITATVLRSGGTKSKTGDAIDEQLENIAASVESSISEDVATVSFNCLKENIDEVLGVYADVLSNPEFRQDKIDLIKTQFRSAISRRYDDASSVSGNEFNAIVYGRLTPFGREVEYETVDAISRSDLQAFFSRYYVPANTVFLFQGDFDTSAMRARVEQVLGAWSPLPGQPPQFPNVTNQASPGIYLGEKTDVTQTFLSIGHLGGLLNDKDYPALEVMSDILGGGFDSRLFRKVRTELGYAYGVGGGWGAGYKNPGTFRIFASTKGESTAETIQVILAEIEKMRSAPVSEEELRTAKEKVINSFVFNFDRPQKTLSRLAGYPKDFLSQYQKAIAAVTKEDILRVAKQYVQPAKFVIVAVGNPASFKTPLTDLKLPVTKLDLTVKQPKREAPQVSEASLGKGRELLARMQAAAGGADKLAAVKDIVIEANSTLGNMPVKQKVTMIFPDKLRQEQTLPFGKVVVMWDGKAGTVIAPNAPQPMPMPAEVQRQVKDEMFRSLFSLLLSDRTPGRTVSALSATELEIADKEGHTVKVVMDAATGLPAAVKFEMAGPQGPSASETLFKDWKEVAGVQIPHTVEIMQGGRKVGESKYETVTVNGGVQPDEIMKP